MRFTTLENFWANLIGTLLFLNAIVADATRISESVDKFSTKLHENIFHENATNLIWSPLSVFCSLVPFLEGTSGNSLSELQELLGLQKTSGFRHQLKLNHSSVSINTGLFVREDIPLGKAFSEEFDGVLKFKNTTGLSDIINAWMSNATNGIIKKVLDNVREDTRFIVTNGVAFKGTWQLKFTKQRTQISTFHGLKGPTNVEMMKQKSMKNYGAFTTLNNSPFEVLKLGYRDSPMNIIIALPEDPSKLGEVWQYLTSPTERMHEIMERMQPHDVEIQFPKMKVKTRINMVEPLKKAGLTNLFSPLKSNFSEARENSSNVQQEALHVDEFIHETVLDVDEDGTRAGAATTLEIVPLSAVNPKTFLVNKPFILFLRWEGRWTFFEGLVTDLPGVSHSSLSGSESASEPANWWVHKGPPEYLDNANKSEVRNAIDTPTTTERFQQPEPKDPEGIRFPNPKVNGTKLKYKFLGTFHGESISPFISSE